MRHAAWSSSEAKLARQSWSGRLGNASDRRERSGLTGHHFMFLPHHRSDSSAGRGAADQMMRSHPLMSYVKLFLKR